MSIAEIASNVESETIILSKARAVLRELMSYFEDKITPGTYQAHLFIINLEQYLLLMYVVDEYIMSAEQKAEESVNLLHMEARQEKGAFRE